jgi:hypothetical protein
MILQSKIKHFDIEKILIPIYSNLDPLNITMSFIRTQVSTCVVNAKMDP